MRLNIPSKKSNGGIKRTTRPRCEIKKSPLRRERRKSARKSATDAVNRAVTLRLEAEAAKKMERLFT